jgi:hypothetical protein
MRFSKKRIGGDRDGRIEGLPLQLMIMVIVAGLGTAVLVGWMGGLTAPEAISSVNCSPNEILLSDGDGDGTFQNDDVTLTIIVRDQNGDPVERRLGGAGRLPMVRSYRRVRWCMVRPERTAR